MGEPAYGDQVDTAGGDGWGRRRCDTTGGFGQSATIHHCHRLAQFIGRHVVEEHGVDADIQRLLELSQGIDLKLYLDHMPGSRARPLQGLPDAAGDGDVIVLNQYGIVEAEAMIATATSAHGVFL